MKSNWHTFQSVTLVALALMGVGCSVVSVSTPTTGWPELWLASPGTHPGLGSPWIGPTPIVVAGTSEVIRGRVRYRVDAYGAHRSREVTTELLTRADRVPKFLGGGSLYATDSGTAFATGPDARLRSVLKSQLLAPSFDGNGISAQIADGSDWVHIGLPDLAVTRRLPVLDAPLIASAPVRPTGPEFVSASSGFAISEVLGPVHTNDGGRSWRTLDWGAGSALGADFGGGRRELGAFLRIIRDGDQVFLKQNERVFGISPTGRISPVLSSRSEERPPGYLSLDIEALLPFGVLQPDGKILVGDGRYFVLVKLETDGSLWVEPLRGRRDLGKCELRPPFAASGKGPASGVASTQRAMAAIVCRRSDAAGSTLSFGSLHPSADFDYVMDVERIFPDPGDIRVGEQGEMIASRACEEPGTESFSLMTARIACVRDVAGRYRDVRLGPHDVGDGFRRVGLVNLAGGSVLLIEQHMEPFELRAVLAQSSEPKLDPKLSFRRLDRAGTPNPTDTKFAEDEIARTSRKPTDMLPIWPLEPGSRVVHISADGDGALVWIVAPHELIAVKLAVESAKSGRVFSAPRWLATHRFLLDSTRREQLGFAGNRALLVRDRNEPIEGSSAPPGFDVFETRDGAVSWRTSKSPEWPSLAPRTQVECGRLGCRMGGITRIAIDGGSWDHERVTDEVRSVAGSFELPRSEQPSPSVLLVARCHSDGLPVELPAAKVPVYSGYLSSRDALLGADNPKLPPGYALVLGPFAPGGVRGGLVMSGPSGGSWGDMSRLTVRFSTDLDPLDVVHSTAPIAAPFADHMAATRSASMAFAVPLGPGRILFALCEFAQRCDLYRAVAGLPLERIPLSLDAENHAIVQLGMAREVGGSLLLTGLAVPAPRSEIRLPFVARVGGGSTQSTVYPRSWDSLSVRVGFSLTVDQNLQRIGLALDRTWNGGATWFLPLDGTLSPAGAFEQFPLADLRYLTEIKRCTDEYPWTRGEQGVNRAMKIIIDDIPGMTAERLTFGGSGGGARLRFGRLGTCLERFTLLGPKTSFQWSESGDARLWSIEKAKPMTRKLKCTLGKT